MKTLDFCNRGTQKNRPDGERQVEETANSSNINSLQSSLHNLFARKMIPTSYRRFASSIKKGFPEEIPGLLQQETYGESYESSAVEKKTP
ncbi:hypothetical protein NPIL_53341 [Nephila pilipes]|uniref:Uncharacterized protein n=1 Tax=Nephila pilipes TaxID=299642 RepID=A0A8X6NPF1_NEPPI|nr:hypothetical protein NPIL_53341 [Nephila pilipes]